MKFATIPVLLSLCCTVLSSPIRIGRPGKPTSLRRQISVVGLSDINSTILDWERANYSTTVNPGDHVDVDNTPLDLTTLTSLAGLNLTAAKAAGDANLTTGYTEFDPTGPVSEITDLQPVPGPVGTEKRTLDPSLFAGDQPDSILRLGNGKYMKVYYGAQISKFVLKLVTTAIYNDILTFAEHHSVLQHSIDFWAVNEEGVRYNWYAHLPGFSSGLAVSELKIAFQAMFKVLERSGTLALSWDYIESDGKTPIISGFLRRKFDIP